MTLMSFWMIELVAAVVALVLISSEDRFIRLVWLKEVVMSYLMGFGSAAMVQVVLGAGHKFLRWEVYRPNLVLFCQFVVTALFLYVTFTDEDETNRFRAE